MKPIIGGEGEGLEQKILQEAENLLSSVNLSPRDSVRLEGAHVAVMVVPEWLDHMHQQFEIEVSCYPFSQAQVDWSTVEITVKSVRPVPSARLTRSGACVIGPLDAGVEYRLQGSKPREVHADLLAAISQARFTGHNGTMVSRAGINVFVEVQPAAGQDGVIQIALRCESSRAAFDWESIGLLLENSSSGETYQPKWLDASGQVVFTVAAQQDDEFLLHTAIAIVVGLAGKLFADAAARDTVPSEKPGLFAYLATSADQRITSVAWGDPGGVITIHVKTREIALRNGTAHIEFRSADGHTIIEKRLTIDLEERDSKGDLTYWGAWMKEITLPVDATMRVWAFPAQPKRGDSSSGG